MNEDNLLQRIDELMTTPPFDVDMIQQSADALQRRFNTAFDDLGLTGLAPTVKVVPEAGYEILLVFPMLGRSDGNRVLVRLEDIQRALPTGVQVEQGTALFNESTA